MTEGGGQDEDRAPRGDVVYREPARSWVSVWLVFLLLVGAFALDFFAFGSVIPVAGWIVAIALIVGVYALLIYSARATRSLVLTTEELWVGDEMLIRAEIVGVDARVPRRNEEYVVLGWPTGMPRAIRGVTVRLADEQDVVLPTRHADRLQAALGVGAAQPKVVGTIRAAGAADLEQLPDIDSRAGILFRLAGYHTPELEFARDKLADAKAIFVVDDPPIAFIWLSEVDGVAYVEEVAVIPKAMRKGIGGQLIANACAWAHDEGYPAITLITYADVAWNGPFYAARGFVETDEITPGLAEIRAVEAEQGLDEVGRRIVMRRELT